MRSSSWQRGVCELIGQCHSADLENVLEVGVYNSRGVVTKSPFDGGTLEREIADRLPASSRTPRMFLPPSLAVKLGGSQDAMPPLDPKNYFVPK